VADITYIRLLREFIYLAVLLDAFSRRCIGWAISRNIDTQLTLSALQMALNTRTIHAGLIHHSDRGVQYAATDYVATLQEHKIEISMSRTGNPYDNAKPSASCARSSTKRST
jgi:transposase InsO family protein